MKSQSHVIVALDFSSFNELESFVNIISPNLCKLKVGKELFTKFGPKVVEFLQSKGFDINTYDIESMTFGGDVKVLKKGVVASKVKVGLVGFVIPYCRREYSSPSSQLNLLLLL